MTYFPRTKIEFADSLGIDAFGRAKVSQNNLLLSSAFTNDKRPLIWDESITGTASSNLNTDRSTVVMTVGTDSGDKIIRQTKEYYLYRAGQSHYIRATAGQLDQVANVRKRFGYFDDDDGIFLEVTGSDVAIVLRSSVSGSPVDTRITQANWNVDSFDGTGPSGFTVDWTKAQHLYIDLQWLGVGRVRFALHLGGIDFLAHEFNSANITTSTYMKRASLPVRYEIENTDASSGASLEQICQAVVREGGLEEEGLPNYIGTSVSTPLTATTTARSSLSVRLRSSSIREKIVPISISVGNLGAGDIKWELMINPVLASALSFSDIGSISEYSITQVNYTSGGRAIAGGHVITGSAGGQDNISINSVLGAAASINGTPDVFSIIIETSGGTDDIVIGLKYLELF